MEILKQREFQLKDIQEDDVWKIFAIKKWKEYSIYEYVCRTRRWYVLGELDKTSIPFVILNETIETNWDTLLKEVHIHDDIFRQD
jgi:hypothetical protein